MAADFFTPLYKRIKTLSTQTDCASWHSLKKRITQSRRACKETQRINPFAILGGLCVSAVKNYNSNG